MKDAISTCMMFCVVVPFLMWGRRKCKVPHENGLLAWMADELVIKRHRPPNVHHRLVAQHCPVLQLISPLLVRSKGPYVSASDRQSAARRGLPAVRTAVSAGHVQA